ncbi:hypothetical protein TNCV_4590811, partial [Trichonephila clavipes]
MNLGALAMMRKLYFAIFGGSSRWLFPAAPQMAQPVWRHRRQRGRRRLDGVIVKSLVDIVKCGRQDGSLWRSRCNVCASAKQLFGRVSIPWEVVKLEASIENL